MTGWLLEKKEKPKSIDEFLQAQPMKPLMRKPEVDALFNRLGDLTTFGSVLEYGSGGSTVFFAQHLTQDQHLWSVEHNRTWFAKVFEAIKHLPNVHQVFAEPDYDLSNYPYSLMGEELPAGCTTYLNPPNVPWHQIEIALVDGIARGATLAMLRTRLRPGTFVFLHDYDGRQRWYDWAIPIYTKIALTDSLLELQVP